MPIDRGNTQRRSSWRIPGIFQDTEIPRTEITLTFPTERRVAAFASLTRPFDASGLLEMPEKKLQAEVENGERRRRGTGQVRGKSEAKWFCFSLREEKLGTGLAAGFYLLVLTSLTTLSRSRLLGFRKGRVKKGRVKKKRVKKERVKKGRVKKERVKEGRVKECRGGWG